jgi:hypothetical protein
MAWIWIASGGAVVIWLLAGWAIGARLPRAHVVTARARYRQPPEVVWAALTNLTSAPNWRSGVRRIERLPDRDDGRQVWIEWSRRSRLPLEFEVVTPGVLLVSRIVGERLPFGGSWTYGLLPDADGSVLTITEEGEIYSPFFRFVSRLAGHDATLKRYLRDLGRKFGEKTNPERVG